MPEFLTRTSTEQFPIPSNYSPIPTIPPNQQERFYTLYEVTCR